MIEPCQNKEVEKLLQEYSGDPADLVEKVLNKWSSAKTYAAIAHIKTSGDPKLTQKAEKLAAAICTYCEDNPPLEHLTLVAATFASYYTAGGESLKAVISA